MAGAARFSIPTGLAIGEDGTLIIADLFNHTIRQLDLSGAVTTIAGRSTESGSVDGQGASARFNRPHDVAVDAVGTVYVADSWNHAIRKISPDGVVSTVAGRPGIMGSSDGKGAAARFAFPKGIAVDALGTLYVSDTGNHTIRRIRTDGTVSTLAGRAGVQGSSDGLATEARFAYPTGLTVDRYLNVYIADTENHTIRKITIDGVVSTLSGVAGSPGSVEGATGASSRFNRPEDVTLSLEDPDDLHLLVADTGNHTIRLVRNGGWSMIWSGEAGEAGNTSGGHPRRARYTFPSSLTVDYLNAFYIADTGNQMVRVINNYVSGGYVGGSSDGEIGNRDGAGWDVRFNFPSGIALDRAKNLYVADVMNHAIRKGVPTGDEARIDSSSGPVGAVRELSALKQSAHSWRWELVRRPAGSNAQLSSTTLPNPIFIPDVADYYVFRLTAHDATGPSITHVMLRATPLPRRRAVEH